jgi:antitoxin YefM
VDSVSVNKFRDNLKALVNRVITNHSPLKVTRRAGEDFVVVSAEDWEREQETLHILQSGDLMRQIAASLASHAQGTGYRPKEDQLDEITGLRG